MVVVGIGGTHVCLASGAALALDKAPADGAQPDINETTCPAQSLAKSRLGYYTFDPRLATRRRRETRVERRRERTLIVR